MRYFSTFSGIGGFEQGILNAELDWECMGYSEIDKYASAIYNYHFPNHTNYGDITTINESELPDFELFVGGFPCQAFSIAGKRQGFEDTRGTLFFDVARILSAKKPTWVILENVKGLLNHDGGKTAGTIFRVLSELGYSVGWEVLNSCHFGVPQNRERVFIVGCLRKGSVRKIFPIREEFKGVNERAKQAEVVGTLTAGGNSGGMHSSMTLIAENLQGKSISNTLDTGSSIGTLTKGHIRRLTPIECERLQGFPDNWTKYGLFDGVKKEISDTQRYKCCGNAVTTNVITEIVSKLEGVTCA